MKKNIFVALGITLIVSSMAISACGGKKAVETSAESQQAEVSEQANVDTTAETTAPLGPSKMNFDIANALDGDYDSIVYLDGTPSSDTGETGDIRILSIGERQYMLYNTEDENHGATCFRVESTAGDIYSLAADKMTVEDFEKSVDIIGEASVVEASSDEEYAIVSGTDKMLTFVAGEGYDIQIALDADGGISKDSKAAMSIVIEDEESSADDETEETEETEESAQ